MELESVPVETLNAAAYNPRVDLQPADAIYENLKRSIETFGFLQPIIVNRRNQVVVGGHQRLKVLKELRYASADVIYVDLPSDREKALNLTLNKTIGSWDEHKLAVVLQELEGLPNFDVQLTGFSTDEVGDLVSRFLDEQDGVSQDMPPVPDFSKPAVTRSGELLELGEHRLLCADATQVEDVRRVMNGQRATLFATDPPYLVGYDGTNHPGRSKNKNWSGTYGVTWDDAKANPELHERFIRAAVAEAITPDAAWYCWHASRRQALVEAAWTRFGAFVHQQIIWVKDRPILSRSWYSWQHEPCFFGWVRPHRPRRVSNGSASTTWQFPTVPVGHATEHPTSKPVELFAIPLREHTRRGEVCYEPFCGSGSQLIAAEQLGRRCFALEISPHYCDVIVRRWLKYVDSEPARLNWRSVTSK